MRNLSFGIALLALLAVAAVGTIWLARSGDVNVDAQPILAGYLPHHGYLPLFVAEDKGLFEKNGLDVELRRFDSSNSLITAFINGDIEVAPVATSAALVTEARDPGIFRIFAFSSETPDGHLTSLVARPDSGIEAITDLKGRKVGIWPGPAAKALFLEFFEKAALKESDIHLQPLAPPTQIAALTSGTVDALATYEPIATLATRGGGAKFLEQGPIERHVLSPTQGGAWLIRTAFVESSPESAAGFVRSIFEAIDVIRDDPRSAYVDTIRFTGNDEETARSLTIIPYSKAGEIDFEAVDRYEEIMIKHGVLSMPVELKSRTWAP